MRRRSKEGGEGQGISKEKTGGEYTEEEDVKGILLKKGERRSAKTTQEVTGRHKRGARKRGKIKSSTISVLYSRGKGRRSLNGGPKTHSTNDPLTLTLYKNRKREGRRGGWEDAVLIYDINWQGGVCTGKREEGSGSIKLAVFRGEEKG